MIKISDFDYQLPDERIAQFPLEKRDESKLLVFEKGKIQEKVFKHINEEIPEGSLLISNNTKVIPARLFFRKETGAVIEVFLLDPISPTTEIVKAMETEGSVVWKCMIGNLKRWKAGQVLKLEADGIEVSAELVDRDNRHVKLSWDPINKKAVDVIQAIGKIPIPPYMNREATDKDSETYQTVYAKNDGAVAAPTAGLHFTEDVFETLDKKGVKRDYVTLHVGAGTFQPVKEEGDVTKHTMHSEQFVVKKSVIKSLLESEGKVTVVGTTSMRTLESTFWLGNQMVNNDFKGSVAKLEPYETKSVASFKESFQAVYDYLVKEGKDEFHASTEIMIFPGYEFRVCNQLITNFHQPESTLMLLVAAFIGENWKKVYQYALDNDFRFLSYGDSSILKRG